MNILIGLCIMTTMLVVLAFTAEWVIGPNGGRS